MDLPSIQHTIAHRDLGFVASAACVPISSGNVQQDAFARTALRIVGSRSPCIQALRFLHGLGHRATFQPGYRGYRGPGIIWPDPTVIQKLAVRPASKVLPLNARRYQYSRSSNGIAGGFHTCVIEKPSL